MKLKKKYGGNTLGNNKINEKIIEMIRKKTENNELIGDFLIELLYYENEHPNQWKYKKFYKNQIEIFLEKGENKNEN